ncbi:cupin domain-containing protein [Glutamicibacter arilaitensis]|uniref:cupin domain-containing protein n=1 Tax=Glutamicibacter arilaitensis TaxID=256701 RepID=UPI00384D10C5
MPDEAKPLATLVDAANLPIAAELIPEHQQLEVPGTSTSVHEVGNLAGASIGIWEMSVGAMRNIEAEEYFVVLSGAGNIKIEQRAGFTAQEIELVPGSLVRLHAGMHTEWRVTQTLRKIYLSL